MESKMQVSILLWPHESPEPLHFDFGGDGVHCPASPPRPGHDPGRRLWRAAEQQQPASRRVLEGAGRLVSVSDTDMGLQLLLLRGSEFTCLHAGWPSRWPPLVHAGAIGGQNNTSHPDTRSGSKDGRPVPTPAPQYLAAALSGPAKPRRALPFTAASLHRFTHGRAAAGRCPW